MTPREALTKNLLSVAQHDVDAFDAVYKATSAKLFGIVLRILHRRDLAEEVLQEVYLKVWERADTYDPAKGSPITWMAILARNHSLDVVRRQTASPLDHAAEFDDPRALTDDDAHHYEIKDDARRLIACLEALPEDKRKLVLLAYHEGYSRDDLSRRFGAPVNTIKTWLHRSLAQLRDCLGS